MAALPVLGGIQAASAAVLTPAGLPTMGITDRISSLPLVSGGLTPSAVAPGDTFSIAVTGFTTTSGVYITAPEDVVFGTTQVFTGAALGGQTLTISSGEVVGPTTTTDTITISVPINFIPVGSTLSGSPFTTVDAQFGAYNSGTVDPLSFGSPINPATLVAAGTATYNTVNNIPLNPGVTLTNGNSAIGMLEGVSVTGTGADISNFNVSSFTFSATYANPVPEPATATLGLLALVPLVTRRHRQ